MKMSRRVAPRKLGKASGLDPKRGMAVRRFYRFRAILRFLNGGIFFREMSSGKAASGKSACGSLKIRPSAVGFQPVPAGSAPDFAGRS